MSGFERFSEKNYMKLQRMVFLTVALVLIFPLSTLSNDVNYQVKVKGGFVRTELPDRLVVRALSLEPEIMIRFRGERNTPLKVEIVNVAGKDIKVKCDGIESIESDDTEVSFTVSEAMGDRIAIKIEYAPYPYWKWESLNFIAVSDTHLGDPAAEKYFGAVLKHINARRPTFAVDAGDVIDVDEPPQWDVFEEKQKLFKVPLFTTIGNHDSYISTKLYREHLGDLFYGFRIADAQFLFLDNAQKYNNATLYMSDGKKDAQWDWLRSSLKYPDENIFVFFHFPVFGNRSMLERMYMQSTSPEDRQKEVDSMMSLFREADVDYILHGHLHSSNREDKDGLVFIRLGGGGGSKASHTDEKNVNFTHIFFTGGGVREYITHVFHKENEIEEIEFCETPDAVPVGLEVPLIVHGRGNGKLFAIEPEFTVESKLGEIKNGNFFVSQSAGRIVTVKAEYLGMIAEDTIEVISREDYLVP